MWIFSYQVIILMYQYQNKYYIVRKGDFAVNGNKKIVYSLLSIANSSLFDGGDVSFLASYVAGNSSEITEYANNDPYFENKADFTGDVQVSGAEKVRMASVIAGLI